MSLSELFRKICSEKWKDPTITEVKTAAFIELERNYDNVIKEKLGNEIYENVWVKQPHLRGTLIRGDGKLEPPIPFNEETLFIDLMRDGKPYKHTRYTPLSSVHLGQRKLLIAEIYFLMKYSHLSNSIVYVGASNCLRIPILCRLFPNKHFVMFELKSFPHSVVKFSRKYPKQLTLKVQKFPPQALPEDFILVSDLHSDVLKEDEKKWLKMFKPIAAMISFCLPYIDTKDKESDKIVNYFQGKMLKQAWSGIKSSETRMILTRNDIENGEAIEYSARKYESILFEHNIYQRSVQYSMTSSHCENYDSCFDCCMERFVLEQYCKSSGWSFEQLYQFIKSILGKDDVRLIKPS